MFAAENGHDKLVRALLKHNPAAQVAAAAIDGATALSFAADGRHKGIVSQLIHAGADLELPDRFAFIGEVIREAFELVDMPDRLNEAVVRLAQTALGQRAGGEGGAPTVPGAAP